MKMKFISLLFILMLQLNFVYAQIQHEVKVNLSVISNNYIFNYESVLTKRIGVEATLGFDFRNIVISDFDLGSSKVDFYEFSASQFNPSIGIKYYFIATDNGSGFFVGPYTRLKYLLYREDGYVDRWEDIYDRQASVRLLSGSGIRNVSYGLHVGGKLILKDHYLIEFATAYTLEKEVGIGSSGNTIYNGSYFIKMGYRF